MNSIVTIDIVEKGITNSDEYLCHIVGTTNEFTKTFDHRCMGWCENPEINLMFLRSQERYANDVLRARGYLFLNEVLKMLDIPITKIGQVVGWIYDNENGASVDFGLSENDTTTFILHFNVSGVILNKI